MPVVQGTATPQALQTADAYITLQDSAVQVHHFLSSRVEQIPANRPQQVAWSQDNEYIAWTEKTDTGSSVVIMDSGTQHQEVPYQSRQAITDLLFSPQSDLIAFVESGSLFTMTIHGEQIRRIAEHVSDYVWSPNGRSLVVSTQQNTQLATPSELSSEIIFSDIGVSGPLMCMTFKTPNDLVGCLMSPQNSLQGVTVNIQTQQMHLVTDLDSVRNGIDPSSPIVALLSPDATEWALQVPQADGTHRVFEYSFIPNQLSSETGDTKIVGWAGPHIPILLQDFHLVTKQAILPGGTKLFIPLDSTQLFARSYITP